MRKRLIASLLVAAALISGCNLNLVGQDNSKLLAALTPTYTGGIPNPWYLYQEDLMVGDWMKGMMFSAQNPGMYPKATMSFTSSEAPYAGSKNIKFHYNAALTGIEWFAAILIHTPDFTTFGTAPGINISSGNFTKCKFYAKASAATNVEFKAHGVTLGMVPITTSYQAYQINLPVNQTAVKEFFVIAIAQGQTAAPLSIFIDDLRYEQ